MSAAFYTGIAAKAGRLLERFGTTITVKRTTGETLDPVTGTYSGGTTTTYKPKGLFQRIPQQLIDGTRILQSDRMIVLDSTVEPLTSDTITVDSEDWTIQEVRPVKPNGANDVVHFVRVRR